MHPVQDQPAGGDIQQYLVRVERAKRSKVQTRLRTLLKDRHMHYMPMDSWLITMYPSLLDLTPCPFTFPPHFALQAYPCRVVACTIPLQQAEHAFYRAMSSRVTCAE